MSEVFLVATASDIASYLILLADSEPEPDSLTHMQVQKLLYYVQGWALAARGEPMFSDRIEAWSHGPVVKSLYPRFADYRNAPIPPSEAGSDVELSETDKRFVESVWSRYGKYSASGLRDMTHKEPPWKEARKGLPEGSRSYNEISCESMRKFFSDELEKHLHCGATVESLERASRDLKEGRYRPLEEALP